MSKTRKVSDRASSYIKRKKHTEKVSIECPCGKRAYRSRKAARQKARNLYPESLMNVYKCPQVQDNWHMGHIPQDIRRGVISKGEVYGK